jgi:hypothetical protein
VNESGLVVGTTISISPCCRRQRCHDGVPLFADDKDRLYVVHADDSVVVDVEATAVWKAKRTAEDAVRHARNGQRPTG